MAIELIIGYIVLGIILFSSLLLIIFSNYYEKLLLSFIFLLSISLVYEGYNVEYVGVTIFVLMILILFFVKSRYFKPYILQLKKVKEYNRKIIMEEIQ